MLVVPNKEVVVINTNIRDKVLAAIPHAKPLVVNGKPMVAVPHGVEECLVLRNLGFRKVPSPILSYYKWPGRFSPMSHQRETAAFLVGHRRALNLSDPGTGKTASALWAADFLIRSKIVKRVLVIAPLSTLKDVWAKELITILPHRSRELIVGTREKKLAIAADPDIEVCIVNHDGVEVIREFLPQFDLVIYDEATALKNPGTDRFKCFFSFVQRHNTWLWLLTGTPFSQTPVDAWALARLVNSKALTTTYTGFRELVMRKFGQYKWLPRDNALDICRQVLIPSIRYTLDECKEIPPTVVVDRETSLSPAQTKAFKEMREKAVLLAHDVTAVNAAVVMQKLIQIVCGVVYDSKGDAIRIDASQRLATLKETLEEAGDKAIIFVPLRGVQEWLASELIKEYGKDCVASVHGDVSLTARNKIFDAFQTGSRLRWLIAHPRVASHGLTLTRAKTVIWYAPIYSLEQYEQANARIRRIGTEGKTRVMHLYATNFERELYSRLKNKKRVLGDFLQLVKGVNYGE